MMAPHATDETQSWPSAAQTPKEIQAVANAKIVDDNVWQWIHDVADASPRQPIANLGTGFIEYNPPDFLIEAHKEALNTVEGNQYAPVAGSASLKRTIADIYSPLYNRELDPEKEICTASGAQEGLLSCVMSFIQPGDEVILLEPVFTMYVYQIKLAGGTIRYVPLRPPKTSPTDSSTVSSNDWTLDPKELEAAITPKTKMIYFNNPHNPLGKLFTPTELQTLADISNRYNLLLLSDEVYERIPFPSAHQPHTRIATLAPTRTLTAVSLGKLFNATGWRVGFVIGPEILMKSVIATHLVLAYSSSGPAQEACAVGLRAAEETGWWARNAADVERRVGRICQALDEIDLPYVRPLGAYFIFVRISSLHPPPSYSYPPIITQQNNTHDWKVCYFLVQECGVTSIPGSCFFGPENAGLGEEYIRLGACKSDEGLSLAAERLKAAGRFVRKG